MRFQLTTILLLIQPLLAESNVAISAMRRDFANKPFPRFENGILCGVDIENHRAYGVKADGTTLFDMAVSVPDATQAVANRCAAAPDGTVALTGWATNSTGGIVMFIAFVQPSGVMTKIQQMDFAPARISFDPKGNLWVVGCTPGIKYKMGDPRDIFVRKYTPGGLLLRSVDIPYGFESRSAPGPLEQSWAVSTEQGLYILLSKKNDLIFVPADGADPKVRHFQSPDRLTDVSGFSVTKAGGVYMSGAVNSPQLKVGRGVAYFRWDENTNSWKTFEVESFAQRKPGVLLGSDGDRLLSYFNLSELIWHPAP